MFARSFRAKLLYLLIAVLLLLQAATLVSVHFAGRRATTTTTNEELRVGTRVFNQLLASRARQLSDSLRVLVLDFAFREAIASGDVPTISSVLSNHGSRIAADSLVLVDLDGVVVTDTHDGTLEGKQFPFGTLIPIAEREGEAAATVTFAGQPYQIVLVPVLAPRPIAWVCAGFEIDERLLNEMSRLTSLNASIWSANANPPSRLVTTFGGEERLQLARRMTTLEPQKDPTTMQLSGETFSTVVEPLRTADGSRIDAVLQRSLDEARRPFVALEFRIFLFSTIALVFAVAAAIFLSRSVSKPLRTLATAASRVEQGDYQTAITLKQEDEIGQLATAFNAMQSAIAAREMQIIHQARHDVLTGLPNRTRFLEQLTAAIAEAKKADSSVGMIIMDVDRFKEVNDTLGHHSGDQLIVEIGRRLAFILHEATVARLGGDEFAVFFAAADSSRVEEMTRRINSAFLKPFVLGEVSVEVMASLGVAIFPKHADDAETLMQRAEVAMYDAKKSTSRVAVYEPGRDEHTLRRLSLMTELRQAIQRDELELHYQPKIDVATNRTLHAEALVRWNHARHGVMRPDEFIPLAEQTGNISLITKCVLRKAIKQCAQWVRDGLDMTVAVNLSAADLFDSELPTYISGLLSDASLSPTRLVLELTESTVMKDAAFAHKILGDLKARGMTLAIDDFGTGYSSLAHLKRLPVDELKIDKSFVLNLNAEATNDLVIVRSTIELAHTMGLRVTAEGVESEASYNILRDLGCEMAQGYWMSKPLSAENFAKFMATSVWGNAA